MFAFAPEVVLEIIMAIAVGGLIGIEREHTEENKYAGVRTLSLLTGVAPAVVAISQTAGTTMFVALYLLLAAAIAMGIVAVRLYLNAERIGFTTSVSVFVVSILGVMIGYNLYKEATALAIITALLLAQKRLLHDYIDKLEDKEISSAFQLGALSFILIPILPATAIDPFNAIVPQEILLLTVFVMAIEFLSYVSMRQLSGSSGIYLTGLLGGGASSFATTGVLSKLSSQNSELNNPASSGILLAAISGIIRNLAIAGLIFVSAPNAILADFAVLFIPATGMIVVLSLFALYFKTDEVDEVEMPIDSPISFKTGIKFGMIFILVALSSKIGGTLIGDAGNYIVSFVGGLVSTTAVSTSAASSFGSGSVVARVAAIMIIFGIMGGHISKIMLIELENTDLRKSVSLPMLLSSLIGIAALVLL